MGESARLTLERSEGFSEEMSFEMNHSFIHSFTILSFIHPTFRCRLRRIPLRDGSSGHWEGIPGGGTRISWWRRRGGSGWQQEKG